MSLPAAWPAARAPAWAARHERPLVLACVVPLLGLFAAFYLPLLPNGQGSLPADYALWLPDLLVGDYWFATNGFSALPWFSPAVCAGVPYFADPQVPYFSLTQALTLLVSPMTAVRITILAAAAAGFLGAYALARLPFRASPAAAALAGVLFMFNLFYATRMLIGHFTYYSFMLLPALLLAVLPWGERRGAASEGVRVGCAALLIALTVEAGMAQLVVPVALTASFVLLLAGLTVGWSWRAVARLALAAALGAALSAGKLAASFALLAHYPRDFYTLPGFRGLWNALWLPVQMLFLWPPQALQQAIGVDWSNRALNIRYDEHEFTYGVTPLPALLLAAAGLAWLARRQWRRPTAAQIACLAGLLLLSLLAVAANAYAPGWNAWLKTLPLLRNSSNLMRWFAAWILPATLAAALAVDRLAARHGAGVAVPVAFMSGLAALVWVARADLSYYEDHGYGASAFPVAPIEQGWAALHAGAGVPPVAGLTGEDEQAFAASFTQGQSQLVCYWPIFGYWRENLRAGTLHPGAALVAGSGRLNLRNPVCDVFPEQNSCRPGDQFAEADRPAAEALLTYRPVPFRTPWWMDAAQWLNGASALLLAVTMPICAWLRWRRRSDGCA